MITPRLQLTLALLLAFAVVLAGRAVLGGGGGTRPGTSTVAAGPVPPRRTTDLAAAVRLAGAQRYRHARAYGVGDHTTARVRYPNDPPTNGPHDPRWVQDGSYAGLAPPPVGQVVHAQEHGRIVLQYRPGLPLRQLRELVGLWRESPAHVLLLANATNMRVPVAATAWGQGVRCPTLSAACVDALRAFRDAYRDKGPEVVP